MASRNRVMYASQAVWANGHPLYRVQTFGSTTTFTNEDIFEIGHLDIIDVVDDVPAVAITLNTNDFGDVKTMAILAQVADAKLGMTATAVNATGNLVVVSGTQLTETTTFLHGASLADFAIVCGNLPGVSLWAPVQSECDLGTLANNIDQTMYLDEVYVNSLEFAYTTGANATENYGAECDNKMYLLNDGRFLNWESFTLASGTTDVLLDLDTGTSKRVVEMEDSTLGFLRTDADGYRAVTLYDYSLNTMTNYRVEEGVGANDDYFVYNPADNKLYLPNLLSIDDAGADILYAMYAANAYTQTASNVYFEALSSATRPENVGAIRQGQVEVYIVATDDVAYESAWRLTGCTVSCDLTREPLTELGHLGPYDRPLTLPIPITVTVDSTAGDLANWAKFADLQTEYDAGMSDINLTALMTSDTLKLVVMIYEQTDVEAGGTGSARLVKSGAELDGVNYFNDGVMATYSPTVGNPVQELPLKTIVVEHLKMTDEAFSLDMGANATQTYGFRSTNDLYVVKGGLSVDNITDAFKVRRNS